MKQTLLSSCCNAKARVNMREGGYFCDTCGKNCSAKAKRTGFGSQPSTLNTVRKPTGERPLFIALWAKCGGKSEVSGEPLHPPEHHLFHFQGSHLLPKGTYPDYRLDPRNLVMMTPDEHEHWHRTPRGLLLADPKWAPIVARYKALQAEAERKSEPSKYTPTVDHP